jgi:hypothetical protein
MLRGNKNLPSVRLKKDQKYGQNLFPWLHTNNGAVVKESAFFYNTIVVCDFNRLFSKTGMEQDKT